MKCGGVVVESVKKKKVDTLIFLEEGFLKNDKNPALLNYFVFKKF